MHDMLSKGRMYLQECEVLPHLQPCQQNNSSTTVPVYPLSLPSPAQGVCEVTADANLQR